LHSLAFAALGHVGRDIRGVGKRDAESLSLPGSSTACNWAKIRADRQNVRSEALRAGGGLCDQLDLYLIKPTRYDDDVPVQWWRSLIPSNSLACVAGLVNEALGRGVLAAARQSSSTSSTNQHEGRGASIVQSVAGETRRYPARRVQTNQFPRAMDIARPLRPPDCRYASRIHVSGLPVDG